MRTCVRKMVYIVKYSIHFFIFQPHLRFFCIKKHAKRVFPPFVAVFFAPKNEKEKPNKKCSASLFAKND